MDCHQIAANYDAIADDFLRVRSPEIGLDFVNQFATLLPSRSLVLDVGCGTGLPLAKRLVEKDFEVYGIDISKKMLQHAKGNVPEAAFEIANITSWCIEKKFDGILAWDSLFHLSIANQLSALENISRMLKPGGFALLTLGNRNGEITSSMFGKEFFYASLSKVEYLEELSKLDFEILFSKMEAPEGEDGRLVITAKRISDSG